MFAIVPTPRASQTWGLANTSFVFVDQRGSSRIIALEEYAFSLTERRTDCHVHEHKPVLLIGVEQWYCTACPSQTLRKGRGVKEVSSFTDDSRIMRGGRCRETG